MLLTHAHCIFSEIPTDYNGGRRTYRDGGQERVMDYRWHEIVSVNYLGGQCNKGKGRWEREIENCLRTRHHDAHMFKNLIMGFSLFLMITEILIMISTKKYLKITLIRKYYIHNSLFHIVMKLYLRKFWHPANFHPDIIWLQSQWKPYYRTAKEKKISSSNIY